MPTMLNRSQTRPEPKRAARHSPRGTATKALAGHASHPGVPMRARTSGGRGLIHGHSRGTRLPLELCSRRKGSPRRSPER
jgi:hypothetical protein